MAFCFIAAFLLSARYISAAIFGSSVGACSSDFFNNMLESTGSTLANLSIVSLIVGIIYLVSAELDDICKLPQKIDESINNFLTKHHK